MEYISSELKEILREEMREFAKEVLEKAHNDFGISRDFITLQEACKYLNASKTTILSWQDEGLKIIKINNKLYISRDHLYDFFTKHTI